MRRRSARVGRLGGGAVLLLVAACTGPRGPMPEPLPGAPRPSTLCVHHDLPTACSITLYLVDPLGSPRWLGQVSPGVIRTFDLPPNPMGGDYRVRMILPAGFSATVLRTEGAVESPAFSIYPGVDMRWSPAANTVTRVVWP
jgi:hypothetical protein